SEPMGRGGDDPGMELAVAAAVPSVRNSAADRQSRPRTQAGACVRISRHSPMRAHSSTGRLRSGPPSDSEGGGRFAIKARVVQFSSGSRRLVAEHCLRRKLIDKEVSDWSRRGNAWKNFFLAEFQIG